MKRIGIIGAGTMGSGIARVAAQFGMEVLLQDVSRSALKNAQNRISSDLQKAYEKGIIPKSGIKKILDRIKTTTVLKSIRSSELIIEAIIEDLNAKQELFLKLDTLCSLRTILATNTSSLSVTAIGSGMINPQRLIGLHFFNPVPYMKLVEVIPSPRTSEGTTTSALRFIQQLHKEAIVAKDTPGFIVNRIARPFYGEALRLLGEGVASVEEIDRIVKLEGNFKMGPFELMDTIGIDVNLAVTKSMYEQSFHEPRYRPHLIQQQKVNAGTLGKKTKEGFYSYAK